MSFYFLINNIHFALSTIGAVIVFMAAWLSFDAYKHSDDTKVLFRALGLSFIAVGEIIHALDLVNDLVLYFGFGLYILGTLLLILSFLKSNDLVMNSIVVVPAFATWNDSLYVVLTILIFTVSFLSFRQLKRDYNRTWIPFSVAFLLLGVGSLFSVFTANISQTDTLYIIGNIITFSGFIFLGLWVWQYMRLRIKESTIMILISATFLLSTVITLAFSTILIDRISTDTSNNLMTDAKVLTYLIDGMKQESLVKAELISKDTDIAKAVVNSNVSDLEELSSLYLEKYNLGFLTITDVDGNVLVRANMLSKRGDSVTGERVFEEAILKNNIVTIEDGAVDGFSIRSGSPIYEKGVVVGAVITGFQLDNAMADKMKKYTGLEMFIYNGDHTVASTFFDNEGYTRLTGYILDNNEVRNSVLVNGTPTTGSINILGTAFQASYLPLSNSDDKNVGMISIAEKQQNIVNLVNTTNRLTLFTVVIILFLLLIPIYFISKKVDKGF